MKLFRQHTEEPKQLPSIPSALKNSPASQEQQTPAPINIEVKDDDDSRIKEIVIYSAIGLLLVGGTIYLGNKLIKDAIANTEEKKSLDNDSAASYAKQIKLAFDNDGWWGTNEEALRTVLRRIPSKEFFRDVAASYKKLYDDPITKNMQEELTAGEYEEMMMILATKPEKAGGAVQLNPLSWAKRLHSALNITYGMFSGTDEDAIKAVFLEIPTKNMFGLVHAAYNKEYGTNLITDLGDDLSTDDFNMMMGLLNKKPIN